MPKGKTLWRKEIGETNGKRNFFREVLEMRYLRQFRFSEMEWYNGSFILKGWVWRIRLEYAKKWYGKSRNCLSFSESACLTPKERLFLMPYYWDGKRWLSHCFCRLDCARKIELRDMAIKISRCQHGKKMKRPWLYSLEEFQGILSRFFHCRAIVGES